MSMKLKYLLVALLFIPALALGTLGARWFYDASGQSTREIQSLDATAKEGTRRRDGSTDGLISSLQESLKQNPYNASAYSYLGAAYLQKVRESGDPSYYTKAEGVLSKALELDSNNFNAISGMGALALARHHFADALQWGERGAALNPYNAGIYGVIGDAHIELGQYDAAFEAFQKMVNTRPDLASYARVSYARELLGDRPGAIENMQAAVNAGAVGSEGRSWALVQLANLYFDQGELEQAQRTFQAALDNWAEYPYARAGLGKVYAAQGDYARAIDIYSRLVQSIPLPEFVIALGDVYMKAGRTADAAKQYELVAAMQQLFQANGVDTDAELALFNADHQKDLANTLKLARSAYERRSGITVADTVAWTLYQSGDYPEAKVMMDRALRLGTKNPLMFYHAAMIQYKLGNQQAALDYLDQALNLNPRFSLLYADSARQLRDELRTLVNK